MSRLEFIPRVVFCDWDDCTIKEPHCQLFVPTGFTVPYFSQSAAKGCLGWHVLTGKLKVENCSAAKEKIEQSSLTKEWTDLDTTTQEILSGHKESLSFLLTTAISKDDLLVKQGRLVGDSKFVVFPPHIHGHHFLGLEVNERSVARFGPYHSPNQAYFEVYEALVEKVGEKVAETLGCMARDLLLSLPR